MKIVELNKKNMKFMKNLWLESFKDDSPEFYDLYLNTTHKKGKTLLLKIKDEYVSMLTYINKEITMDQKIYPTILIEGVATPLVHQRKGYMDILMRYILNNKKKKYDLIVIQAYNNDIYKKYGFIETHNLKTGYFNIKKSFNIKKMHNHDGLLKIYKKYVKQKDGFHNRTNSDFRDFFEQVSKTNGYFISNNGAYLCFWGDEVFEIAYSDVESMWKLIHTLDGNIKFRLAEDEEIFGNKLNKVEIKNNTMLLIYNKKIKINKKLYFPEYV